MKLFITVFILFIFSSCQSNKSESTIINVLPNTEIHQTNGFNSDSLIFQYYQNYGWDTTCIDYKFVSLYAQDLEGDYLNLSGIKKWNPEDENIRTFLPGKKDFIHIMDLNTRHKQIDIENDYFIYTNNIEKTFTPSIIKFKWSDSNQSEYEFVAIDTINNLKMHQIRKCK